MNLEPGMVIARPVLGGSGMQVTLHLAEGVTISASTISQLVNKGVECVAVVQESLPDAAVLAHCIYQYELRLRDIFGPEPDENCRPLFDAMLKDGF